MLKWDNWFWKCSSFNRTASGLYPLLAVTLPAAPSQRFVRTEFCQAKSSPVPQVFKPCSDHPCHSGGLWDFRQLKVGTARSRGKFPCQHFLVKSVLLLNCTSLKQFDQILQASSASGPDLLYHWSFDHTPSFSFSNYNTNSWCGPLCMKF